MDWRRGREAKGARVLPQSCDDSRKTWWGRKCRGHSELTLPRFDSEKGAERRGEQEGRKAEKEMTGEDRIERLRPV
eukprot:3003558-Pleurochrysis_carterae.AAC.1